GWAPARAGGCGGSTATGSPTAPPRRSRRSGRSVELRAICLLGSVVTGPLPPAPVAPSGLCRGGDRGSSRVRDASRAASTAPPGRCPYGRRRLLFVVNRVELDHGQALGMSASALPVTVRVWSTSRGARAPRMHAPRIVTLLFTDVEGSTRLLGLLGDAFV